MKKLTRSNSGGILSTKGFTLVELLATISILAVLSLILIPIVNGIINKLEINADLKTAQSYVKAAENYYTASTLDRSKKAKLGTNIINELELNIKPASGKIYVDKDGNIKMAIIINNRCYSKEINEGINDILVSSQTGCGEIREVEIREERIPDSGIYARESTAKVKYKQPGMEKYIRVNKDINIKDGNKEKEIVANEWIKIENREVEVITTEDIIINIRVSDGFEIKEETYEIENMDGNIPSTPIISGGSNDWGTTSKVISIATPSNAISGILKYQYYISNSNEEIIGGEWRDFETSSTTQEISNNGTHYIYVKAISNVELESEASSYEVVKKDDGIVTAPVISGGNNSWTSTSRTISVDTESTALSGIAKYQYYESTSETELTGGSWNDFSTTSTTQTITTNGIRYIYVRGISNAGVASEESLSEITKIDTGGIGIPGVLGSSNNWSVRRVLTLAAPQSASGIKRYDYYISNTEIAPNNSTIPTNSTTQDSVTIEQSGKYIYFRAVNNLNQIGDWTSSYDLYVDIEEPSVTLTLNSTIKDSDNISFPTSYDLGLSGGTVSCLETTTNSLVTNSTSLLVGDRNIKCTASKNNGLSKDATKSVTVKGYYTGSTYYYNLAQRYGSNSGSSIILPPGSVQYGPYKPFEIGVYEITISGNNLDKISGFTAYTFPDSFDMNIVHYTSSTIIYRLNITSYAPALEFVINNDAGGYNATITIDSISVSKISSFYYYLNSGISLAGDGIISDGNIILTNTSQYTWGPYVKLPAGTYRVYLQGNNLNSIVSAQAVEWNGSTNYSVDISTLNISSTYATFEFHLTKDCVTNGVEIYIWGNNVTISKYRISK